MLTFITNQTPERTTFAFILNRDQQSTGYSLTNPLTQNLNICTPLKVVILIEVNIVQSSKVATNETSTWH